MGNSIFPCLATTAFWFCCEAIEFEKCIFWILLFHIFFLQRCWKPDRILVPKSNFMNDSRWRNQPPAGWIIGNTWNVCNWCFQEKAFPFPREFGLVCVDMVMAARGFFKGPIKAILKVPLALHYCLGLPYKWNNNILVLNWSL